MNDIARFDRDTLAVTRLSAQLAEHVLPLFSMHAGGYPEMFGTGFLVEHEGAPFLLSAAHVLDHAQRLFYYVDAGTTRRLSGRLAKSPLPSNGTRHDDRFDIAVLKIEGLGLPPYPAVNKRALPLAMLQPQKPPRGGEYLAVGFPASKTKTNRRDQKVSSEPVSFRNISASRQQYDALGVSPGTHIVLPLDLKRTIGLEGKIQAFASPHGMSGAPLFSLPPGYAGAAGTPVVGLVVEHHTSRRALVATDIRYAIDMVLGYKPFS